MHEGYYKTTNGLVVAVYVVAVGIINPQDINISLSILVDGKSKKYFLSILNPPKKQQHSDILIGSNMF